MINRAADYFAPGLPYCETLRPNENGRGEGQQKANHAAVEPPRLLMSSARSIAAVSGSRRAVFFICAHCDRGHRYCSVRCRQQNRAQQRRRANALHQQSLEGRLGHRESAATGPVQPAISLRDGSGFPRAGNERFHGQRIEPKKAQQTPLISTTECNRYCNHPGTTPTTKVNA